MPGTINIGRTKWKVMVMKNIRMFMVIMFLTWASGAFSRLTEFLPSDNEYSQNQGKQTTKLDIKTIELENKLRDKYNMSRDQEKKLREELANLEQKKAAEERMTKHLNELGALDAALKCNVEILKQINDEIRRLKNLKSHKKTASILKDIKKQTRDLKKQQGKLDDVVKALIKKRDGVQLKIKKIA